MLSNAKKKVPLLDMPHKAMPQWTCLKAVG